MIMVRCIHNDPKWQLKRKRWSLTNNAKVMHCLPVRRNVELSDAILDGQNEYCNTTSFEQGLGSTSCSFRNTKKQWISFT
jgi:ornithine carbamoyltransferase